MTVRTLRFGEAVSPGDSEGHMEVAALGDARFEYKTLNFDSKDRGKGEAEPTPAAHSKYQTFTGNADVLKYDHRKRTVIMQGNGLSPAKLYRQERAGAPMGGVPFSEHPPLFQFRVETVELADQLLPASVDQVVGSFDVERVPENRRAAGGHFGHRKERRCFERNLLFERGDQRRFCVNVKAGLFAIRLVGRLARVEDQFAKDVELCVARFREEENAHFMDFVRFAEK